MSEMSFIYALYIQLIIKKRARDRPANKMPFEWRFASGPILVQHCVLAEFIC